MRLNKLIFFSLLSFIFVGCTHSLHVAHVSDFSPTFKEYSKGELVKARAEQFTVMGIVTDTNYVNDAYTKLLASLLGRKHTRDNNSVFYKPRVLFMD